MSQNAYPSEDSDTNLININNTGIEEMDVYIGSKNPSYNLEDSIFKNPFDKSDLGNERALVYFRMYLYRRYLEDEEFRKSIHATEGETLGCHCYPKRCHGEAIVDLIESYTGDIESLINHMRGEMEKIDNDELGKRGFKEYEACMSSIQSTEEEIGD